MFEDKKFDDLGIKEKIIVGEIRVKNLMIWDKNEK